MPDSAVYEPWDCDLTGTLPERSHLYHLRPIGVGTEGVESLTGYVARLAEAHNVGTGVLLTRELLPRLQQQADDLAEGKVLEPNYAFIYDAYILNGISRCPGTWVRVLETLTGQTSLHVLTMLSWAQIISDLHLLRRERAWCSYCFDCWRNANQPIYEPLLWALRCISICPVHRHALENCCRHCKRGSPALSARARPGYCYNCRTWLGTPVLSDKQIIGVASFETELSIASAAGDLLAAAPALQQIPSGSCFKDNLRRSVDDFTAGNHSHFARVTSTSLDSIYHWLNVGTRVRLDSFLRLCCKLRLPPARFLSERIDDSDPDWERARDLLQRSSSRRLRQVRLACRAPETAMAVNTPTSPGAWDLVRGAFERLLCEPAPRSLQAVARELGFNNCSSLYRRLPELCPCHGDEKTSVEATRGRTDPRCDHKSH